MMPLNFRELADLGEDLEDFASFGRQYTGQAWTLATPVSFYLDLRQLAFSIPARLGGHYCMDWDLLYIFPFDEEAKACSCFAKEAA